VRQLTEREGVKRCLLLWHMQLRSEIRKWKINEKRFRDINHKNTENTFFNPGFAEITNAFENRITKLALVNCLLSRYAGKIHLVSQKFDRREIESEIINETPVEIDKDERFWS
jgi:hypothetical protein